MPNLAEITRIQSYLREVARQQYDSLPLPPFTLFFHPTDSLKYFNYAIPDCAAGGDLGDTLAQLRRAFQARGRTARFEFFEAFAPDLPVALRENGFREEERLWSMLCTPQSLRPAPEVPGLEIIRLDGDAPDESICGFIQAQREGFDPENAEPVSPADIAQARSDRTERGWRSFLGLVDGEPAGVAVFGRPIDGVSEIAGIATRPAFRRRGIASLLTWHAVSAAFADGVQTACLTAADEAAGRVYERVGFAPFSTMLAYIDAA